MICSSRIDDFVLFSIDVDDLVTPQRLFDELSSSLNLYFILSATPDLVIVGHHLPGSSGMSIKCIHIDRQQRH